MFFKCQLYGKIRLGHEKKITTKYKTGGEAFTGEYNFYWDAH
jgi:hypothetical protein